MFATNDPTIMAMLANYMIQKAEDSHSVVETIDRGFQSSLALSEKQGAFYFALAAWRAMAHWKWFKSRAGDSHRLFSARKNFGKAGTAGFESSKRQALDQANSWVVPKAGRAKPQGGNLGVERQRRVIPIEPLQTGEVLPEQGECTASPAAEKATASSAPSEEHPAREMVCSLR